MEKSRKYVDVAPVDETLFSHLNINTLLPAKVGKKTSSFVKYGNEGSLVIKEGSLTVEINKLS